MWNPIDVSVTANPSGDFSIKSAWELCRQRDQYQSLSLNIWHHLVPLKWSFLTWSAINQGVPLDDCLCKKGFQMVYKCNCCDPAHCESINHIFVTGNLAQQLWSYFENKLHISGGGSMLHHKLSGWWIAKVNSPSHKAVLSLIPNSICWELWCSRNKGRFEGKSTQVAHVIRHIEDQIKTILVKSKLLQKHLRPDTLWPHQFGISVPSVMRDSVIITSWHKPEEGWVKLNSDGCAKGNPGLAAGGSIVRTDSGSVLWGQYDFYGITSNMVAEAKALLQGLKSCVNRGKNQVEIEVDSLVLKHIPDKENSIPWVICYVRQIRQILAGIVYKLLHTFRENNKAADWLAHWGIQERKFACLEGESLPKQVKGIARMDRSGTPNLRLKKM